MNEHQELPAATSISELDLHLRYMRIEVHKLVSAMPQMATKDDIAELSRKFQGYATHEDVRVLRGDVENLRQQIKNGSVGGSIKAWAEWAQRLSAIAAFVAVCALSIAHLVVKLQLI
jgi:hypothetical protein